jgi:hypothetical protein
MPPPKSTGQKPQNDDRNSWHQNSKNPKEPWPLKKLQILSLTITHARACGCFDNTTRIETGINVDVVQVPQKERAINLTLNQGLKPPSLSARNAAHCNARLGITGGAETWETTKFVIPHLSRDVFWVPRICP